METNSLSHWSVTFLMVLLTRELLFLRIETVITFRVVPQAVPRAFFESTNT